MLNPAVVRAEGAFMGLPIVQQDTWDQQFTNTFNSAVQEYIDEHIPGELSVLTSRCCPIATLAMAGLLQCIGWIFVCREECQPPCNICVHSSLLVCILADIMACLAAMYAGWRLLNAPPLPFRLFCRPL